MSFGTFWGTDPTDPATYEKILDRYLPTTALGVQSVNVAAPIVNTGTPQNPVIAAGFANAGDLLVGTGANTGAVLGIAGAAAGDYLRVNAGVNGIEWSAGAGAVPSLSAVLAVGNDGNAAGITNAGNIGCADIQAPFGSISAFNSTTIQDIGGTGLGVLPVGTITLKGCQTKGSLLAGDGTSSVEVPIGAAPNGYVLTADATAASGMAWEENGKVSAITGGNNISIDNTAPLQPIVNLKNPLDATLNVADVAIAGTSTDAISKTITTNIRTLGGIEGEYEASYSDTTTGDAANARMGIEASANNLSDMEVSWYDNTSQSTAQSKVRARNNQSDIQLTTNGAITGYTTTRDLVVIDGFSADTTTSTQPSTSITSSRIEQTGAAIGVNNYLQMTQGSINSYNTMNVNLNSSTTDLNYTFASGGSVQQFLIENDAGSGTGARIRFQHNETGGAITVAHRETIQVSNSAPSLSQTFLNTAVNPNSINTTLTTTGSGASLSCDNFLTITGLTNTVSAVGNTTLQSTSGNVIVNSQTGTSTISATTSGVVASHVLDNGLQTFSTNKATNPQFVFQNTTTNVSQYPSIKLDRPNVASTVGNTIGAIGFFADNAAGTSYEFGRIQTKTENVAAGNEDGTISVFGAVNGTLFEVFNFNGGTTNEMNSFRPLDMNNNAVRTSTGDLTIDTSASSGNGILTLATKNGTGGLVITGDKTQSATAGGAAGTHLVITLNGNVYKIALLNP